KPVIMGILNVTPDSFSDGGRFQSLDLALAQARKLVADGADIIDVGAESTRPGHTPVSLDEEWRRLEPVLAPLIAAVDAPFSLDTEADLNRFFLRSLALADRAGVPRERILIDPGIGFGKTKAQNLRALALT